MEMGAATRYAARRNTASIMKILFYVMTLVELVLAKVLAVFCLQNSIFALC